MPEILNILTTELELDPFAELTRTYTATGFNELAEDIAENGLKEPITLRRGKILDGRHRYRACKECLVDIIYTEIGGISDEKALDYVISKSISKDSMSTAAKVEAFLLCKAKGIANNKMPLKFRRLSPNDVKKISKIYKADQEYLQILLRQQEININDIKYKTYKRVSTINALWNIIVSNENEVKSYEAVIDVDNIHRADQSFVQVYLQDNEENEAVFWDLYNSAKDSGDSFRPSSAFGIKLMDLIKVNAVLIDEKLAR